MVEMTIRRKKNWIGHVVREKGLLKVVLEDRMEGKSQEEDLEWG